MNRQKRVYGVGSKIGLGRVTTSILALPLDVTKPRDSFVWNCRDLETTPTLGESLVMSRNQTLAIEPSSQLNDYNYDDYYIIIMMLTKIFKTKIIINLDLPATAALFIALDHFFILFLYRTSSRIIVESKKTINIASRIVMF